MAISGLAPYFFPTTTVFVDDDASFLEGISVSMPDDFAFRVFERPRAAIEHIEQSNNSVPLPVRCLPVPDTEAPFGQVTLDLSPITDTLYSEQRFSEVAVAVIDYDMPGINGLELCRRLAHLPIKKVLLTGKADETTAIKAFNAGLINHFISKGAANIVDELQQTILELQQAYFRTVSAPIAPALSKVANFLSDEAFATYFSGQMAARGWVEFYLDPIARGLLCITAEGKSSLLLVAHRNQLASMAADALSRQRATAAVTQLIAGGEVIPNPYDDQSDWRRSLTLAHPIPDTDWLVAEVNDPKHLKIEPERLLTFDYYLGILDYLADSERRH